MKAGYPSQTSPIMRRVADELQRRPGVTAAEFGKAFGWSASHTSGCLAMAKRYGLAGYVRDAEASRWYPAGLLEAAKLAAVAAARARESRRASMRRGKTTAWHLRDLTDVPVHRVGATGPLPFRVKAARSVFDLAGVL